MSKKQTQPEQDPKINTSSQPFASERLLKSKMFVPSVRSGRITRPHLVSSMNECTQLPLTLLSAPPGFGKTAVLAEWAAQAKLPIAWLNLDSGDNALARFFTYLIAALNQIEPDLGAESLALVQLPQMPAASIILTSLIAELETCSESIILVLDDYQAITSREIHEALIFLIEHLPPQLRLIIATRTDPPFPLARLRVHNELGELRAADLRFTLEETAAFLNESMSLDLTAEDIRLLETRTEGWIAGLQIAALSLRGQHNRSALVKVFSGSQRHLLDYLGEEILARQSEQIQQFLIQTSILERLCGSLCDTVLNETSSQAILEFLDQSNLFLVPLDEERNWYRYHHLFAEVLHIRLERQGAEIITALHLRAAKWYEQAGHVDETIHHALKANAIDYAAEIVNRNWQRATYQGQPNIALGWLEALPMDVVRHHPGLSMAMAWTQWIRGQAQIAQQHGEDALQAYRRWQGKNISQVDSF